MKKVLFAVAVVALLLSVVGAALASQTNVYSDGIGPRKPMEVYITTYRQGDVSARVTWSGKPSGNGVYYYLTVAHCTDPEGTCAWAYDVSCETGSLMWPTAEMSCTVPNGPAGIYQIEFTANTKANATLEITAETN